VAVRFGNDARTEFPSNTTVRVRGTGNVVRARSGQLSGRAEMSFDFDTIRLRSTHGSLMTIGAVRDP
jgi:hypothetical protein